nr:phosphatidylinositol binding clathrin assembly [Hymenolepis microstoma]
MAARAVKRLAGNGTGQSLVDRMTSMKHSLAGSLIAKTICKATTEEMIAPKRKHLNILVNYTYEPRLSMPEFANYIIGRSHNSSWVISFKALITIHHLMNNGSERFSQYLASNNCQLATPRSFEKSGSQATMFLFIRHYARYLDARSSSYREVAFDFCKIRRKNDDVNMKTMPQAKLFRVLPPLERQVDALLAFDASSSELFNSVVLAAYVLLYKDLIRLYAVYNEGMINIIEKFFSMSKKDCQESLRVYKAFLKRMENVNQFIKVAEACDSLQLHDGFGKQSLIFKPVPTSVLDALEGHLAHLEGKKSSDKNKASPTLSSPSTPVTADLLQLQDSSNQNLSIEQQRIIEEERQRLEAFVSQARAKCANNTPEHGSTGNVERSNSDGDLLQLFTPTETAATSQPSSSLFDDFFFLPAMPASSSQLALSTATNVSPIANQPRPLSQFLTEPLPNPNNPFLTSNSLAWPTTGNDNPSAKTLPASTKPSTTTNNATTGNDLDSRLAEIADQLSISSSSATVSGRTATDLAFAKSPPVAVTAASSSNPWLGPGGVLQPTTVNSFALTTNQKSVYRPQMQPSYSQQQQMLYPVQNQYALSRYPNVQPPTNQIAAFNPHQPMNAFPPVQSSAPAHSMQSQFRFQQSQQQVSNTGNTGPAYNPLNPFL